PQRSGIRAKGYEHLLHLTYAPVVTLHNPYDVPIKFDTIKVSFSNIPIGFQFLVEGQPLTTQMNAFNTLYLDGGPNNTKEFGIKLIPAAGGGEEQMTLKAGQTKLFG